MNNILQLWLNPINLGVLFLCFCIGIWLLAHTAPNDRGK